MEEEPKAADSCPYGNCPGYWRRVCCEEARQVIQVSDGLGESGMTVGTPDVVTAIKACQERWNRQVCRPYEEEHVINAREADSCQNPGQKLYVDSVKTAWCDLWNRTRSVQELGSIFLQVGDLGSDSS